MKLDFNEIQNGDTFEDLVVSYFENLKNEKSKEIIDIVIKPTGPGADGGRDILVNFMITDSLMTFERRWVIQCKFHSKNVSTDKIADINIPTLLHSYKASGYLLICKEKATSKLTQPFERLEQNCIFGNKYIVWSGNTFKLNILNNSNKNILKQYFPIFYNHCVTNNVLQP